MKRKNDFLETTRIAWGDDVPDWVEELAKEANRTSQRDVAARIGYSAGLVSAVFARKYGGDMSRVSEKVRGALMGATVICPIVGEIGRDRCLDEQKMDRTGASSIRAKLYRACRAGCPHSRIKEH